jgi:hypothetical protein
MTNEYGDTVRLSSEDHQRLRELREQKPGRLGPRHEPSRGAPIADWVAKTVGHGASSSSKAAYSPFGSC